MKVVLLLSDDANQRALAHRVAEAVTIDAIILCRPKSPPPTGMRAHVARLARGLCGYPLRRAWFGMLAHFDRRYPDFPKEPALCVGDVNDPQVLDEIRALAPDLAIVSGTNLLRRPLIEEIGRSGKVMNLHTGISPYVRGGPNCTNWCLATGRFDLIGNTVMWIDEGIDSGNLVATGQTPLTGRESLTELHIKVIDHAHALLLRCIELLAAGRPLPNVPQAGLGNGSLYLTRHWNAWAAARAVANFYASYRRSAGNRASSLQLVEPG